MDEQLKKLFDDQKQAWAEFKTANDDLLKKNDALQAEKVEKLNARLTELQAEIDKALKAAEDAQLLAKQRFDVETAAKDKGLDPKIRQAFSKYLRKGAQGLTPEEAHAMSAYSDPDGGYLVLPHISKEIIERLYLTSPMRSLARVETVSSNLFKEPIENSLPAARWKEREASGGETATGQYGMLEIPIFEQEADPKVPTGLLEDAAWDVESRLKNNLSTAFALAENTAFVSGDGKGMPMGILSYASGTNPALGQIQQVPTGDAALLKSNGIIDLIYALKAGYRAGAVFVGNNLTIAAVRKLVDGQNNYLWQPNFQAGQPPTLAGYPFYEFSDMPNVGSGAFPIAFGNFKEAYLILDHSRGMRMLPNPFIEPGFMRWYTTKRTGGAVRNHEALKIQVVST